MEKALEYAILMLLVAVILIPLLTFLLAFPPVLLGVFLVMDGGCLRYLLFGLGLTLATIYGMILGSAIGEMLFGTEFLLKLIGSSSFIGYLVAARLGKEKLEAMPEKQYQAWKQTLTGAALLGFGAGSIAGLFRSAASGFGGFGGGNFGGGGASGSWSGATGAAGGATSTATSSASFSAAATATTAAGGASEAAAVATAAVPGVASTEPARAEATGSRGLWTRLRQWFQKFQWYHGFTFVLATLVFVPLGLGAIQALQNTKFFAFVLVCMVVYSGYKFLRQYPDSPDAVRSSISSFYGGESSSSWS